MQDKRIDLHHVGKILGLPLYVDMASIPDTKLRSDEPFTLKDQKLTIIMKMLGSFYGRGEQ